MVKTLKTLAATRLAVPLVCLLALTLLAPLTYASVLSTGSTVPPSPLFPTGTIVASTSGTIVTPTFSSFFTEEVISDPFNSWCAGCLDFVYTFKDLGPHAIQRFSMFDFSGFLTDVGTDPFFPKIPTTVDRSPDGSAIAIQLSWRRLNPFGRNHGKAGDRNQCDEVYGWLRVGPGWNSRFLRRLITGITHSRAWLAGVIGWRSYPGRRSAAQKVKLRTRKGEASSYWVGIGLASPNAFLHFRTPEPLS